MAAMVASLLQSTPHLFADKSLTIATPECPEYSRVPPRCSLPDRNYKSSKRLQKAKARTEAQKQIGSNRSPLSFESQRESWRGDELDNLLASFKNNPQRRLRCNVWALLDLARYPLDKF
jgi:hypothetical protein